MSKSRHLVSPKSVSQKILVTILLISSIVTIIITIIQLNYDYHQEISLLNKSLELVEKSYSKSLVASLWELNDFQIQTQLEGIVSLPGIEYISIYNKEKLLNQAGKLSEKTIYRTFDLIHYDKLNQNTYLGTVYIYASVDQVIQKIYHKIFIIFITQLFETLLVSFLIYFIVQHIITRHIISIASFVKNLDLNSLRDNFLLNRKSDPKKEDELDILVNSINEMREKLYRSYTDLNNLNKHLEEAVENKTKLVLEQGRQLEYSARMSSLGEMAGGIAHEINNPITIIGTSTYLLKKNIESEQIDKEKIYSYLDKITKTTERVGKIIHGLLGISRDATNETYSQFSLSEILGDVFTLCSEKFKHKDINILVELDKPCFQTPIRARKIQLSQVFLNLLHNSYDAIENLPEKWIKIECEKDDHKLILKFIDSGPGIPKEIREKVMQPFFTTKEVGRGTGLGLSLSLNIIKSHGGDIKIDADSPNTCFIITLPIENNT